MRAILYSLGALLTVLSIPAPPLILVTVYYWWLVAHHLGRRRAALHRHQPRAERELIAALRSLP